MCTLEPPRLSLSTQYTTIQCETKVERVGVQSYGTDPVECQVTNRSIVVHTRPTDLHCEEKFGGTREKDFDGDTNSS